MNNRQMLIAAAIGGLVMTVLSSVPILSLINCLLCAGLWIGGIVAVWFYKRQTASLPTAGQGAAIGAVAGVIGAILATIISIAIGGAMLESMIAADTTGTLRDSLGGMVGTGMTTAISFVTNIILYPLFGAIGGAAYAAITQPRAPKAPM